MEGFLKYFNEVASFLGINPLTLPCVWFLTYILVDVLALREHKRKDALIACSVLVVSIVLTLVFSETPISTRGFWKEVIICATTSSFVYLFSKPLVERLMPVIYDGVVEKVRAALKRGS